MDLKLKDEITKILIETPGLSIGQIAKKTGNYYSYTHKLVSKMEKKGLLKIAKTKDGKKEITKCIVQEDYKKQWVEELKKFMKTLLKDAEIKAAFLMMYLFVAFQFVQKIIPTTQPQMLAAVSESLPRAPVQEAITNSIQLSAEIIILIAIPLLLLVWSYKRNQKIISKN
jgi:hypothetical protein